MVLLISNFIFSAIAALSLFVNFIQKNKIISFCFFLQQLIVVLYLNDVFITSSNLATCVVNLSFLVSSPWIFLFTLYFCKQYLLPEFKYYVTLAFMYTLIYVTLYSFFFLFVWQFVEIIAAGLAVCPVIDQANLMNHSEVGPYLFSTENYFNSELPLYSITEDQAIFYFPREGWFDLYFRNYINSVFLNNFSLEFWNACLCHKVKLSVNLCHLT